MLSIDRDAVAAVSSPLRWAGSKKRIVRTLAANTPASYDRYLEAFAGSAVLFFALQPTRAILNDSNPDLISFYKTFSGSPEFIARSLSRRKRCRKNYEKLREDYKNETDPLRKAAIFLFLNRNCFNGIYRTNTRGEFNVPFSNSRVAQYPSRDDLLASSRLLQRAAVKCFDFEKFLLTEARSGDFVYLDPPYYVPDVRTFREYGASVFEQRDFVRLESLLVELDARGSKFLLSYPECPIALRLAKKWRFTRVSTQESVSARLEYRKSRKELLIRNYELGE